MSARIKFSINQGTSGQKNNDNIILIGFRGAGKTKVAEKIGINLNRRVVHIDKEIENKRGPIENIVKDGGWKKFREIEYQTINRLSKLKINNSVIDCGGGVVENEENIRNLQKMGKIFWLKVSAETIKKRIRPSRRPALTAKSIVEEVDEVLEKRKPLYQKYADYEIETEDRLIAEIAAEIVRKSKKTSPCRSESKICIPITAETAGEALIDIGAAEKKADLIELRLDYINKLTFNDLQRIISMIRIPVIVSCRRKKDCGKFKGSEEERITIIKEAIKSGVAYVDIEDDTEDEVIKSLKNLAVQKGETKIILSHHDFEKTPGLEELKSIYEKAGRYHPDLIKIVTAAGNINDNFKIFKLLRQKEKDHKLIAFCLGLKGQSSRILSRKFGSQVTFAALEEGKESAAGQLTIDELAETYNLKRIDEETVILGIVGKDAEKTASVHFHNHLFRNKKINAVFVPFKIDGEISNLESKSSRETDSEELKLFFDNVKKFPIKGLAVTNPHKINAMKYLNEIDEEAKKIGAINTIIKKNGSLAGCNTDLAGAVKALEEKADLSGKKVLIIGAGGAARAIIRGLKQKNAALTVANRTFETAEKIAQEFGVNCCRLNELNLEDKDIIINASLKNLIPEDCLKPQIMNKKIIMDINYQPKMTEFLAQFLTRVAASGKKNDPKIITGEKMLIYQAAEQLNLWTVIKLNEEELKNAEEFIRKQIWNN